METQTLVSRKPSYGLICAAVFALALVAACTGNAPLALPVAPTSVLLTKLKVCTSAVSAYQLPAWYAADKGLFAKYGLDVELVPLESGQLAATALISGQVDACQLAGANVLNAALAGEDLVLIGGLYNTHVFSLVVNPEIKQPGDLKGKTVAVSQFGTASDAALAVALKQLNLKRDTEVTVIAIGSITDAYNALLAGRISGAMLVVPQLFQAQELGYNVLLDLSTLPVSYQHLGIAVHRRMLEEHRADALNLMRAISDAMVKVHQDSEGAKQVLAKYTKLDPQKDAAILEKTYQLVVQRQLASLPYPTLESAQALLDLYQGNNPKAAAFKAEQLIDVSVVKELDQSGFLSHLK